MNIILYVGIDVHTTNYTLCCYSVEDDRPFAQIQLKPEYTEILKYLDRIKKQRGSDTRFGCTKDNPRLCRGNKRALAENKEIKRIPQ